MQHISSHIKDILLKIVRPCYKELPFMCMFIILMGLPRILSDADEVLAKAGNLEGLFAILGNIGVLFWFAYIGAVCIALIKQKSIRITLKTVLYTIAILLDGTCRFMLSNFNLQISPTWFILLSETTSSESTEFVGQYFFTTSMMITILIALIYAAVIVIFENTWKKTKHNIKERLSSIKYTLSTAAVITILCSLSYTVFIYTKIFNVSSPDHIDNLLPPKDPISSIYTSVISLQIMGHKTMNAIELNKSIHEQNSSHVVLEDSLNIVVVIGESHIKYHSQLYGYEHATNPLLNKEREAGRLYVFDDVITSSNRTSFAMRNILCCNNSGANELWYDYPNLLSIFKAAGYDTYFWDNQRDFSKTNTFNFTISNFLYNSSQRDYIYTRTNNKSYKFDDELVASFKDSVGIPSGKHNLTIFHLLGQHHSVEERFRKDKFKHFSADSIKQTESYLTEKEKEYIANYDNASLYNDYVIYDIIETFKNTNTILIYFSDHGEEVYCYRNQCGRDDGELTANKLKFQYDVPFVIWCSDTYMTKYPATVSKIKNATKLPLLIDNICHILFSVGGIDTPYYRDTLNVIAPDYKCEKRMINQIYNYEEIRFSADK